MLFGVGRIKLHQLDEVGSRGKQNVDTPVHLQASAIGVCNGEDGAGEGHLMPIRCNGRLSHVLKMQSYVCGAGIKVRLEISCNRGPRDLVSLRLLLFRSGRGCKSVDEAGVRGEMPIDKVVPQSNVFARLAVEAAQMISKLDDLENEDAALALLLGLHRLDLRHPLQSNILLLLHLHLLALSLNCSQLLLRHPLWRLPRLPRLLPGSWLTLLLLLLPVRSLLLRMLLLGGLALRGARLGLRISWWTTRRVLLAGIRPGLRAHRLPRMLLLWALLAVCSWLRALITLLRACLLHGEGLLLRLLILLLCDGLLLHAHLHLLLLRQQVCG